MTSPSDDDKVLAFDFQLAICLLAVDELTESLADMYASIWLLVSGDDTEADNFYRSTYRNILRQIADEAAFLTITDEFRTQYEEQDNGED